MPVAACAEVHGHSAEGPTRSPQNQHDLLHCCLKRVFRTHQSEEARGWLAPPPQSFAGPPPLCWLCSMLIITAAHAESRRHRSRSGQPDRFRQRSRMNTRCKTQAHKSNFYWESCETIFLACNHSYTFYIFLNDISDSAVSQSRNAERPVETMIDFGWIRP